MFGINIYNVANIKVRMKLELLKAKSMKFFEYSSNIH